MTNERLCVTCRFFSAASTCIEKPTWGFCTRLNDSAPGPTAMRPRLTWADHYCGHYERRKGVRMSGS
jgi:hypothetical protein